MDGGGGTEFFASQDESHEEDVGDQATAEDEEEQDSGEWAAEEEHEEDEEVPATEAGGSEGSNESVSADSHGASCLTGLRRGGGQREERAALRIQPRKRRRLGGVSTCCGRPHVCLLSRFAW